MSVDYVILSGVRTEGVHNLSLDAGNIGVECGPGVLAQGIDSIFEP